MIETAMFTMLALMWLTIIFFLCCFIGIWLLWIIGVILVYVYLAISYACFFVVWIPWLIISLLLRILRIEID